ncbi:CmcJ/NvfI family oxidoreductase [Sphingosinicella sp.]|uniref:CmcJ/NvfI family oxidoreductase n=1 Tax=Sphingosinicella sp. TaxID=1917971 RepID=UPI004037D5CE
MKPWTRIEPATIEASLNFLRPMKERPVSYQCEPPPGVPVRTGQYDAHRVAIRNARAGRELLSLDVEGFALVPAPAGFADFDDEAAIRADYYPAVEAVLAAATGAALVINFDHNVRSLSRAALGEAGVKPPVDRTHNDFTLRSGPERARAELERRGLDADAWLRHHYAIVNLWRPIGRPVEKHPLALCDARTIRPDDLIAVDLVYRDRVGETYALHYDPGQAWAYVPALAPDEAILIKGYDSRADVARFTAHAAFDDPASPADAPERESIETRALLIFPG